MKKLLIILMVALLFGTVQAANRFGDTFHNVQIVDETGRNVTDITNLFIYLAGTTTDATIYSDKGRQNTITIPMTEASSNTTLLDGRVSWWGPDLYDFSMTNGSGVGPMTNSGHADRTGNEGTLVFPTYLTSITTSQWNDNESITMGTGADWVINGGAESGVLKYTPNGDNQEIRFGVSGDGFNTDLNLFVGTALGLKIDAGNPSFTWDGGAVLLNHDSNFNVGINSGTSTGATTIGSSTSGTLALETTAGMTLLADDASSIKTSAGTLLVEATGGDLTVDATDASLVLRGTEEASDAVKIHADGTAGGVDVDSGTGDITLTSTDDVVVLAADDVTIDTTDGGITLTAGGGTLGDVTIVSADDTIITSSGKVTITNTEPVTISGTFTPVAVNMLHFLVTDQATVTVTAAMSGKILLIRAMSQATTMNLPAEAAGLHYEFWYIGGATATDDHIIDAEANANYFIGGLQFFDSDDNTMTEVYSDASDDAKLTLHNMEAGTRLKITCDGTNWYITGTVYSDTAPAFVNPV